MKKIFLSLMVISFVLMEANAFAADADLIVNGKIGVGTSNPTSKVTVNGTIESTSGGIKFPDGTVQTTAGSGAATQALAKAWVKFNTDGTIQSSYNVSSVTHNGTGSYTINFTNAFADTNYVVIGIATDNANASTNMKAGTQNTSNCTVYFQYGSSAVNPTYGHVVFFGN